MLIKFGKIDQFGSMLPDNFPTFNIDLDCDFQSSDNVYPSYSALKSPHKGSEDNGTLIQEQNFTSFTHIGRRNDNLDRCLQLRLPQLQLFAVIDGHCDPQPTDFLQAQLLRKLAAHPHILSKPQDAMLEVFEQMEREVVKKYEKGATTLVLLLLQETLIVANLGDSKLFGVDSEGKVHELTAAHNLGNQQQLMQVINRGGIVLKKGEQYRINGELNLSRCFGDRHLKYCMSSIPDLYRFQAKQFRRWVMATDGFYNAKDMQRRMSLPDLRQLMHEGTVYQDNASAIFLHF